MNSGDVALTADTLNVGVRAERRNTSSTALVIASIVGLLVWRLFFGFSQNFHHEDVVQIYLLGLKYATTGQWPYFGPDVVHTNQQIPGALQALLVGLPLRLTGLPEAPFILVNALSLAGLIVLAHYLSWRFKQLSFGLICFWLAALPATLQISTNTYNPSYLLFPACLFFVAWFECMQSYRVLGWHSFTCGALMGLAVTGVFQLHMSWPLFAPFVLFAVMRPAPELSRPQIVIGGIAGTAAGASLLLPTVRDFGLASLWSAGTSNSGLHLEQILRAPDTLAKFFTLASYEFTGFNLGATMAERRDVILQNPLLTALALMLLAGLLWQILLAFKAVRAYWRGPEQRYPEYRLFALSFMWITLIFLMTPRPPVIRNFYVLMPIVAMTVLRLVVNSGSIARARRSLLALSFASVLFHTLVGYLLWPQLSFYNERSKIAAAIEQKDFHIFGERRPGVF